MQAGGILNAVITVQRVLRLVAGDTAAVSGLISLVSLQFLRDLVGNFDIFIMGVPSVKVFQTDGSYFYFLRSDLCCG